MNDSADKFDQIKSINQLHKEHLNLLGLGNETAEERLYLEIEKFVDRVSSAGEFIFRREDRYDAQSILDYWQTRLPVSRQKWAALEEFDAQTGWELADDLCPFVGLRPFLETDQNSFFGRNQAVEQLLGMIDRRNLALVYGVHGCGKTSLVSAGLLPKLKSGHLSGSKHWRYLRTISPGEDPIAALLTAVCPADRCVADFVDENRSEIMRDPSKINQLGQVSESAGENCATLLFVDNFEELFSFCAREDDQKIFSSAIKGFAEHPGNKLILSIHSNYISDAKNFHALKDLFANPGAFFRPPRLTRDDLREIIERPASDVGLMMHGQIVKELSAQFSGEAASLPLLQFILLKLWKKRQSNRINWEAYEEFNSPIEVLKETAISVYSEIESEGQGDAVKRVFLDLISVEGDGNEDRDPKLKLGIGRDEFVRERVRRKTLYKHDETKDVVDKILSRFVDSCILRQTVNHEHSQNNVEDDGSDIFEIAHKDLIQCWPSLQGWLRENDDDAKTKRRLLANHRAWVRSARKTAYLLRGEQIESAKKLSIESREIKELLDASIIYDQRIKFNRRLSMYLSIFPVLFLLAVWIGGIHGKNHRDWVFREGNPEKIRGEIATIAGTRPTNLNTSIQNISDLNKESNKSASINLTGLSISEVNLKNLHLSTASFNRSSLDDVNFQNSRLQHSFFVRTYISSSSFNGSKFSGARFDESEIRNTSFKDAILNSASFRHALLCNVDFSEAELRGTSFRGVPYDEETAYTLRRNWWMATGWDLEWLQNLSAMEKTVPEGQEVVGGLIDDLDHAERLFTDTNGDQAWNRIWGLAFAANRQAELGGKLFPDEGTDAVEDCKSLDAIPNNAFQSASAAICLAETNEAKSHIDFMTLQYRLALLHHTLGYVLLQMGGDHEIEEGVKQLRIALRKLTEASSATDSASANIEKTEKEIQFKLFVAGATPDLTSNDLSTIISGTWQPTHELVRLHSLMSKNNFVKTIHEKMVERMPPTRKERCK